MKSFSSHWILYEWLLTGNEDNLNPRACGGECDQEWQLKKKAALAGCFNV